MKLIPASSPGMDAAHKHNFVRIIVDILLYDRQLLRLTANFLRKFHSCNQPEFEKNLHALNLNRKRADLSGTVTAPDHVGRLTHTLVALYEQRNEQTVQYQRAAIVELLTRKLICHRYDLSNELCLNNQKFYHDFKTITEQEIDVAALSNSRCKLEAYECKINPAAFKNYDCINLTDINAEAKELHYRSNVGFVAFADDQLVKIKVAKFQLPDFIKLYGLDSLENLQNLTPLDN